MFVSTNYGCVRSRSMFDFFEKKLGVWRGCQISHNPRFPQSGLAEFGAVPFGGFGELKRRGGAKRIRHAAHVVSAHSFHRFKEKPHFIEPVVHVFTQPVHTGLNLILRRIDFAELPVGSAEGFLFHEHFASPVNGGRHSLVLLR